MTARADAAASARARSDERLPLAFLTPSGRDGAVATDVLATVGLNAAPCPDMRALCDVLGGARPVGAAVIAEEALGAHAATMLLAVLDGQPPWSDLPLVVLTGDGELSRALPPQLELLAARANVTLLERPVRVATLVTVLRSALRARRRQFDMRDQLEERKRLVASERAAREQAEAARAAAEQANRVKAEFLAMMSHELRTPLNAIAGYAQLLEMGVRGPVTAAQRADLERIERSQRHLLSLINDVLNFAKLEAGRVDFALTRVSMHDIMLGVEALVLPQLAAKSLHYAGPGDCGGVVVVADEEKARQVLLNLLSNAIKFTPAGREIRVVCDAEKGWLHTTVTDSGTGIPADKLEAVFEPFVQVDRALASRQEGTGLGLSIARDLARRMGGDLRVTSEVGVGSAFTFTLPRAEG